jgi:hypothetical protein
LEKRERALKQTLEWASDKWPSIALETNLN